MNKYAYVGSYRWDRLKFFAQAIPFGPEKFVCGVSGKHGKRLETYAELKVANDDKTEALVGFKSRFAGGIVLGNISTSLKVQSVYTKYVEIFQLEI
jgi:hypothetical protein